MLATDLGADAPDLCADALGLALRARAELVLVHAADPAHPEATWQRLPTVRALLERWGQLPLGADPAELGICVHALSAPPATDLRASLAARIAELAPDLLVLGTHARSGFGAQASVAEPVSRGARRPTLLLPRGAPGLVDPETGALRLRRVVVPVTDDVPQQPLVDQLGRLLAAIGAGPVAFTMVHVGAAVTLPRVALPRREGWTWRTDLRAGGVVEQVLEAVAEHDADLVATATRGHDSVLDAILGSKTERWLRKARRPLLAVPA